VDQPKRPAPVEKNIRASMERDENATLHPARKKIFSWLAQEQQQRSPSGKHPCILIMDGEEALWTMGETCLTGESTVEVLDLIHACSYFENNASRMRYGDYLKAGYPIASGVIEGACRHVVVDRMEGTGMRWVMGGAQSMLNLRCIRVSGHWDKLMEYHIQRERNEIYPAKAANDASITTLRLVG
jgi:hypothetical protein